LRLLKKTYFYDRNFYMEIELILKLILLAVIGVITGVINPLAGGGSLLTLPMLIFLGLPPSVANGTNRIAILIQSIVTNVGFRSKGVKTYPFSIYFGISATLGAIIGAQLAIEIDGELFNKILAVIMVIVVAYLVLNRKSTIDHAVEKVKGKPLWISIILFATIGAVRGWSKEVIAMAGLVLSLFAINTFGHLFIRIVGGVGIGGNEADFLAEMQRQFLVLGPIHLIIAFFSYQAVILVQSRITPRESIQERLLGFIFGAFNGYLVVGKTVSYGYGDFNIYLIKLNKKANGNSTTPLVEGMMIRQTM